jgi:hypothetical protein
MSCLLFYYFLKLIEWRKLLEWENMHFFSILLLTNSVMLYVTQDLKNAMTKNSLAEENLLSLVM